MKKKIIIFKNDSIGDLVHSLPTINKIVLQVTSRPYSNITEAPNNYSTVL
jgi:hypothetical protein